MRTLERDKPNLLIEIDPNQLGPEEFSAPFDLLAPLGYNAHYYDGTKLRRCTADIQRTDPRRYNFIFTTQGARA